MYKNIRVSLAGLLGVSAGFILQGCFADQPPPECGVSTSAAAQGVGPYFVKLTKVDGSGTCSDLSGIQVGLQRMRTQPTGGDYKLAIKASPLIDAFSGATDAISQDLSNDCAVEEACEDCVVKHDNGEMTIPDGGPIRKFPFEDREVFGTPDSEAEGGFRRVYPDQNECGYIPDPVERRDPSDPDGANTIITGDMPSHPTDGVCKVSNFVGGSQSFAPTEAETFDGVMQSFPAISYKMEFTNFALLNTTEVPGTIFNADLKYTVDNCVANYKAFGFWPTVACHSKPSEGALVESPDCDPNADVAAGRVTGSGINPGFKPMCDTSLGVCVPTADLK